MSNELAIPTNFRNFRGTPIALTVSLRFNRPRHRVSPSFRTMSLAVTSMLGLTRRVLKLL